MRPMKLTFQGVRSYRDKTEVDFTDLSLFALIGDTGAGKSSIIEALCLALYGSTTWSGQVTELISDDADRMSVELTFAAAGDTWTVTRTARRSGAPVHKLVSASGRKADGKAEVNQRIQTVLGLTKDQFLKAVVMPQGRFEELLKATPAHRTEILKGIFRLQSLGAVRDEVNEMSARWKQPVAKLEGERGTLPDDLDAALDVAAEEHRVAAEAAKVLNDLSATAEAAHTSAEEAVRAAAALEQRLSSCEHELQALPEGAADGIIAAATELAGLTRAATDTRQRALDEIARIDELAAAALGGFVTRDAAVAAEGELRAGAANLAARIGEHGAATAALAALEAAPPPAAIEQHLHGAAEAAQGALAEAEARSTRAGNALDTASGAYAAWQALLHDQVDAQARLAQLGTQFERARSAHGASEAALESARRKVSDARLAYEAGLRQDAAAAAARGCQPGDPCPVCDATLPPTFSPPVAADADAAQAVLQAAESEESAANRKLTAAAQALTQAETEHAAATTSTDQLRQAVDDAARAVAALTSFAVTDDMTEDEALAVLREQLSIESEAVAEASRSLRAATDAVREAELERVRAATEWSAGCERHRADRDRAQQEIDRAAHDAAQLPARWRPEAPEPPIFLSVADGIAAALEAHAAHAAEAEEWRGEQSAADRQLLELANRRLAEVEQPTAALVTSAGRVHAALMELAGVLDPQPTVPMAPTGTETLTELDATVTALRAASNALISTARSEHGRLAAHADEQRRARDEILERAGVASLGELQARHGRASSDAVHAEAELAKVQSAVARARQIDEALALAAPFLSALDALSKLLTDGRFVGHLVREREKALLVEASAILRRLSGDRFGFGEGFSVIDRQSGRSRGPDTLSGGERFQASLALALALVEIATRSGGQLEAVFVDEGFGSLDAGSLDQALTTLGAVASGGKLVALVSHLRQVAEHVDQVLLVERDNASGSRVRVLDPTDRDSLLAEDARSRMTA